jgi:uncharacterized protein with FMN-binding domain
MKRAPVVLTATAAGLAATLGFHAHSQTSAGTAVPTTSTQSPSSSPKASSGARTVTSEAISTRYGNVQLRVAISGGKITDVQAVQLPQQDPKSVQISSSAAPLLRQSALSRQSASIDAVSGATYTSGGYKTALQSALDRAGFQASTSSVASAQ